MLEDSTKNITVAVLVYNRSNSFIRCIRSLATDDAVQEITVFDDCSASTHFSVIEAACGQYQHVVLRRNLINLGYRQNLLQALYYLSNASTRYTFLCESDMLLARKWGFYMNKVFELSSESVALSPNLTHYQLSRPFSEKLRKDCFESFTQSFLNSNASLSVGDGRKDICNRLPLDCPYLKYKGFRLRYVSCSVGTLAFRTEFLRKIVVCLPELDCFPGLEDAWLSWACQYFNDHLQTSLLSLDPGLALALSEPGLHGSAFTTNLRWHGSILWRHRLIASVLRILCVVLEKAKAKFASHL